MCSSIGLVTIAQRDLKQMIGYSSVMHMGYAFLGIACFPRVGVGGVVLLMVAHGLSVALLFLLSTSIYHRTQTFEMAEMGGLRERRRCSRRSSLRPRWPALGLPGFANFWGELTIFVALWNILRAVTAARDRGRGDLRDLRPARRRARLLRSGDGGVQQDAEKTPVDGSALERKSCRRSFCLAGLLVHRLLAEIDFRLALNATVKAVYQPAAQALPAHVAQK